jgi:CubicO group peptidase (beta-lactamase class C family)
MSRKLTYSILLLFYLNLITYSQAISSGQRKVMLIHETDSILRSHVDAGNIPGAVIMIKKDGKVIIREAYGFAQKYDYNHNPLEKPEKMTVKHMFDIASLTKVIGTTTSIMLLADRNLIKIDDPVHNYIKLFDTPEKKEITIRHLLTHTAGLYEWYPMYYRASDKEESFRLISELPLKYPVGKQRKYSDLGFTLLGEIIEIVSGLPLEEFMKKNIFQPLRMKNTTYNPLKAGGYNTIAVTSAGNPYEYRMVHDSTLGFKIQEIDPESWNGWRKYILKGEVNDGNAWYANGGVSGAAGLFSTANDLQKIVDMLMNKGMTDSKRFISEKTVSSFLTKDSFNNGLGWMMDTSDSFMRGAPEGSFGHTGFTGTSIVVIPYEKISVILLINRQNSGLSESGNYYNVNPIRLNIINTVMQNLSVN